MKISVMGKRSTAHTQLGSRILVVEDSEDLRGLMTLILEAEGYAVDSASTAEEGLRLLDSGAYGLVLSDYALPGRTGAWMLREALARHLLSQGVIVTAHPNPRDTDGFPVIYKPLDFDAFLERIRQYMNGDVTPGPFPPRSSSSAHHEAEAAKS
jgi:DNA-binding response OmpR family regulator